MTRARPPQYTSRTYRLSRFNELAYSVALSSSIPPCADDVQREVPKTLARNLLPDLRVTNGETQLLDLGDASAALTE